MPRKQRMYLPSMPYHVITRGNNRQACFFKQSDYSTYIDCLAKACAKYKVSVHAYVLMTNHVHLLMTPSTSTGVSSVMQSVGRRYVQHVNTRYQRSGTLYQSRHSASVVSTDKYLLAVHRYIELNPVRAQIVMRPEAYKWSSYAANALGAHDELLAPHVVYLGLGDANSRCENYRKLFSGTIEPQMLSDIRDAAQFSMPLGNDRFRQEIANTLQRDIGYAKRGRPKVR